jgi:hypothetical protein
VPHRILVIDIATVVAKKDANNATQDIGFDKEKHTDVTQIFGDFQLCGQGRRKTQVMIEVRVFFTDLRFIRLCGRFASIKANLVSNKANIIVATGG